jgi:hypothetical protein
VVTLTDAFCCDYLTDEYRDLTRAMAASLSRKRPSPLASGQPGTRACGIIHALGRLNFLSDKVTQPIRNSGHRGQPGAREPRQAGKLSVAPEAATSFSCR